MAIKKTFQKISERSTRKFKSRKPTRGVKTGRGKAAPPLQGTTRGGYVDYLKGMTGKNKTVPLTPNQWKKSNKL